MDIATQTEVDILMAPYGEASAGNAYKPLPTQQRVLDWVDDVKNGRHKGDGIPVLYLQGGVGSGKTRAILAPIIECIDQYPGLRVLIGRQDYADLRVSTMETFFEIYPPDLIQSQNKEEHRVVNNSNSHIFFRELKDLSGLGSQEFGVIMVSEAYEISEKIYRTLKQRVRQKNMPIMLLMEGNPPNEDHWLNRLTSEGADRDPDITMWKVASYENWDNLPVSYRNSLESSPESWKKKYLQGDYGFTPDGTPFYTGFKTGLHQKELSPVIGKDLLLGWDYGFRHPACVVGTFDAKGRLLILHEILGTDIVIEKFAEVVKQVLNIKFPGYSHISYGDPAGKQRTDKSEQTSEDILKSKGFSVRSAISTYRDRKEIIERLLSTMVDGIPLLVIDKSCDIMIDGFMGGYHYPMLKQGQEFTSIKTETPYGDGYYEHIMNSLEYIIVNTHKPIDNQDTKHHFKQKSLISERHRPRGF